MVALIGLVSTLVIPLSIDALQRQKEKGRVLEMVTRISDLRKQAVSLLQVGELRADENDLVLRLDFHEVDRFTMDEPVKMEHPITFNRNGVSNGGEIRLRWSHPYTVVVEAGSGRISLNREG